MIGEYRFASDMSLEVWVRAAILVKMCPVVHELIQN
jgi:hypothetical protein